MLRRSFDPNQSHRYARYGRMSDDEQNPRSPDQQFQTIEEVRKRNGHSWVHVRDFRDDAITGRLLRKRKDFQAMLNAIMTGVLVVDLILVDTYERFGRADELAEIRRTLYNKYGVLVLTADSNFADPTSVAGQALTFVEQLRSTSDGPIKAHNVLRGKRDLIRTKKAWPGGPPPLGYGLKSVLTVGKNGEQEVDYKLLVRDSESNWIAEKMFCKAKETGWGTARLSKLFNADPSIPDKFKPFNPTTIGYILDNPIYYGELLWEQNSTGIIDDTRVIERNAEEDMLRIPGFCEPTVARELWDEVQGLRQLRREQILERRASKPTDGKQIKPLAPGLTLKHPLTGLVRCGNCGASLRPSPTKCTYPSGKVWRKLYYACPSHIGGSCPNGIYVPEPWLREAVIARLRSGLFPPPDRIGEVPDWFAPLVEEVRQELQRRDEQQPDQRPAWEKEVNDCKDRISGWSISLANPRLDPLLRNDIEVQYGHAKARIAQLEGLVAEWGAKQVRLDKILDPEKVLDRLHRLAEVLNNANATRINLELSLHIDRIECFADGKVLMRTSRLGAFDGAVELLRRPLDRLSPEYPPTPVAQVCPRRRARLRIDESFSNKKERLAEIDNATNPNRFAGLEDRWFWQDCMEIPQTSSWAQRNATEVASLRMAGMTVEKLAAHFDKTPPTIRHALMLAKAADPSLKLPRKISSRGSWAKDHAAEVAKLKNEGKTTMEIARQFRRSDTTIRAALQHAEEVSTASAPPTDGRDNAKASHGKEPDAVSK